jgi:hypothetical protein
VQALRIGSIALAALLAPQVARADIPTPPSVFAGIATGFFFMAVAFSILVRLAILGLRYLARRVRGQAASPLGDKATIPAGNRPFKRFGVDVAVSGLAALLLFAGTYGHYRATRGRGKTPEQKSNLGAIRSMEVAYYAEWNVYVGNVRPNPLVDRRGHPEQVTWMPETRFSIIGFAPEGKVYCSYALEGPDLSTQGFTARAECDLDGNGQVAVFTVNDSRSEVIKSGADY